MRVDPHRVPLILQVTIPGDPQSKERPRAGRYGVYTPKKTQDAEKRVRNAAEPLVRETASTPVWMDLGFFTATRRRTDSDNLAKLVLDALNRLAYQDDYLVERLTIQVFRRHPGEEPRTEIMVCHLEGAPPLWYPDPDKYRFEAS